LIKKIETINKGFLCCQLHFIRTHFYKQSKDIMCIVYAINIKNHTIFIMVIISLKVEVLY